MKTTPIAIVICAVILVGGAAIALVPATEVDATSNAEHAFTIDTRMQRVRKVLVRTNAVKKIVAMADAKLLDQEWLQMQFEIDRPILKRDWQVDGQGELQVEVDDSYLGQHQIPLSQSVEIEPDRLHVVSQLKDPTETIREYISSITLTPDANGNASINSSLQLRIVTSSGWLMKGVVKSNIERAAKDALKKQELAIREVVKSHQDELFILPGTETD